MHVYVWEHIVSLYFRTAHLIFTKYGRDEVLIAGHMHLICFGHICPGVDPGRGKIGHGGSPS